jgi:hypothetical protein
VELAGSKSENSQNILAAIAGHDWVFPFRPGL